VAAFDELAKGKAAVPEENMPCHWLVVPADSPVVGQSPLKVGYSSPVRSAGESNSARWEVLAVSGAQNGLTST